MNDLPCACASLVVFVDDDVLFLISLTTTHREAGLPTSTDQCGVLREVCARGRSLGLGSGDLSDQACSQRQEALYFIRDDVLRSSDPYVDFEPSPRACRGGEIGWNFVTLRFCNPCIGFSPAPEHVEGEGL
jgi:hypothetical protein